MAVRWIIAVAAIVTCLGLPCLMAWHWWRSVRARYARLVEAAASPVDREILSLAGKLGLRDGPPAS